MKERDLGLGGRGSHEEILVARLLDHFKDVAEGSRNDPPHLLRLPLPLQPPQGKDREGGRGGAWTIKRCDARCPMTDAGRQTEGREHPLTPTPHPPPYPIV